MSNRTEVTPEDAEKQTPTFQHLAPATSAQLAGRPGEEMVQAFVPRAFEITLSDGSRQRVRFEAGNYPIPARFKKHYYLKANGVTFGDEVKLPEKPELEAGADPLAASKAAEAEANRIAAEKAKAAVWPDPIDKATFKELGDALLAHGVTDEDLKKNFGSTALRLAKAQEMIAAETAANAGQ